MVVYDIQDEPGRAGQERPFPFLPTVDPEVYARDALAGLAIPKIVYRCVDAHPREAFSSWIDGVRSMAGQHISVFVVPHVADRTTRVCRWPRPMRSRALLPT